MPNPATFPALDLTGFDVEWSNGDPTIVGDGHFEHGTVHLDNNYAVSLARISVEDPEDQTQGRRRESEGYAEGRWEAALMRPTADPLRRAFGSKFEPAVDLDHLTTGEVDGWKILGNLDNEGVQSLLETVAAQPTYEVPPPSEDEVALFEALFGIPEEEGESA